MSIMITTIRCSAARDHYKIRLVALRYGECKRHRPTQISVDILIPVTLPNLLH